MTSDGIFPQRLTKIDDLIQPDHWHLTEADASYFIGEYTAYQGYAHSATNRLISTSRRRWTGAGGRNGDTRSRRFTRPQEHSEGLWPRRISTV